MDATSSAIGPFTRRMERGATMDLSDHMSIDDPIQARLLRRIVEHAPVLIIVVEGPEHRVALVNAAAGAALGGSAQRLVGRRFASVLTPSAGHEAIPYLDEVLKTARPQQLREFAIATEAGGAIRYWDATIAPLGGPDDPVDAIVIIASDVTARVLARQKAEHMAAEAERRAQEAEESQRMLDALMAYLPGGIAIADAPDMRVRRVSYHGLAMTKRPWQELIEGGAVERIPERWQIYHLDGRTLAKPEEFPLSRATRRGEIVANEQWLLRQHNGRLIPVLCNAGPIRDRTGEITGAVMSWLDISSLDESRRKLQDAARRFELAIEAGNIGMWDYNLLTGEVIWSERCKAILGLDPDAPAPYQSFVDAVHPDDRTHTDTVVRRAMDPRGDGAYATEFRVVMRDGSVRWIAARGRARFEGADAARRAVRLLGTFRDITSRVEAVCEKENLLEQKDLLLREVNHRVNNSLQLISSLLSLQAAAQPPEIRRQLDEARTRVQTVAHVHRRLYQGDRFTVVDIATYLRGLCADLAKSLGHAYDTRLRLSADAAEVPTELALSLGLVVTELVMNAFKYAYDEPSDGVVEVRFERQDANYCVTVSDNGRGLPAGFDAEQGAGLGMRVVLTLVEKLKAELEISPPGTGTWFRITGSSPALSAPTRHSRPAASP